jgi:hypothetical protein
MDVFTRRVASKVDAAHFFHIIRAHAVLIGVASYGLNSLNNQNGVIHE